MMSDVDIKRFIPTRQFSDNRSGKVWTISSVDPIDEILHVSDDSGFSCRIFSDKFDKYYKFMDLFDEYKEWLSELTTPTKCDCGGLKTYGSLESIYHATWCSLKPKGEHYDDSGE